MSIALPTSCSCVTVLASSPGARFASTWDILVEDDQDRQNELPDEKQLQSILRSWGINNNSKIVICYQDGNAIPRAARLFFTLDYAGLGNQISILNGGLKAWKLEERVLTNELLPFKEGRVDIRIKEEVRITKEEVLANLDQDSVLIIDARPPEKYYGNDQDQNLERFGHIPGEINIPFYKVIMEDLTYKFKTTEELHLLFVDYHIQEGNTIITYCGTGIWASSIYFTARALGYKVQLYDGSFQEWGNDSSYPVIRFVKSQQSEN
jgi:thiosulfate/3-mercaptopyruvate sulfurtransferase